MWIVSYTIDKSIIYYTQAVCSFTVAIRSVSNNIIFCMNKPYYIKFYSLLVEFYVRLYMCSNTLSFFVEQSITEDRPQGGFCLT